MSLSTHTRNLSMGLFALGLLGISAQPGAIGQAAGQGGRNELSGPPEFNVQYQARNPRRCKALTAPPQLDQLVAAVQCQMEADRPTGLFLMQEVRVEMGKPRSYDVQIDGELQEIDPSAQVFPLAGSLKQFWCSPVGVGYPAGANCTVSPMPQALGKCWKTTFGDWKCNLAGPAPNQRTGFPGPTVY
jgi:hypothetical protein